MLSDPEGFADRLAEFLLTYIKPDQSDRDLILMFVDRLFLGLCDDVEDEELERGVQVQFPALSKDQINSLRAMQARTTETRPEARAATVGS